MSVGYPDYARLNRSGGYLLYGVGATSPPENAILFEGYVGSFPYLNVVLNVNATSDFIRVVIAYYTDETFSTQIGFRYVIRGGGSFSVTQYANLSEWCAIFYDSISGNPVPFIQFAIYGAQSVAGQTSLVSTDVPIYQSDGLVALSSSVQVNPLHVQPGSAILGIFTTAAVWFVTVAYYDYGSATYKRMYDIDSTITAKGGTYPVSLPDAPLQLTISNTDTSDRTFRMSLMSTS
jgi:hypothetical protein